ncbi:RBR-type E3 ubiquitin transferase [Mycena indigotica]|uniref:RBR-type E3 ubiquitin transferase n=1 Tax=Mycena indigotica TaxID=2126181 RepID=A0A8H6T4J5_9AGAR|nr:RBR-type E3 ubiquitin transferase [Mycena indigotica]KAF7310252.1 RBR-type E3 ubiquitin transferase [Mycena indigotica]
MSLSPFDALPPELLARIFLQLPHPALLALLRVCKRFREVVTHDPALMVQRFRRPSAVFIDPLNRVDYDAIWEGYRIEPVKLHPALCRVRYRLGDPPASLRLPDSSPAAAGCTDSTRSMLLLEHGIAAELIAIPSVTELHARVVLAAPGPAALEFTVCNADGVRLADFFGALVGASMSRPFGVAAPSYYRFCNATRRGTVLAGNLYVRYQ